MNTCFRPLGTISDFVVVRMAIAYAEGTFGPEMAELLAPEPSLLDTLEGDEAHLAMLDLTMLERTARLAESCPAWLPEAVDRLAERLSLRPVVNYHLLIEANPLDQDPRLFTVGEMRDAELFFYEEHAKSERALRAILELGERARPKLRVVASTDSVISDLKGMACQFDLMNNCMHELAVSVLLHAHFDALRQFWFSARVGQNGPSGLFSSRVALMDLLLTELGDEYGDSLRQREAVMDPAFRAMIQEAWTKREENFHTLWSGLLESHRVSLAPALHEVAQRLVDWRRHHVNAIVRLVPAVIKGAPGTGGVDQIRALLKARIRPAQAFAQATSMSG